MADDSLRLRGFIY
uniref:Uncharacterized protein n=1 Tax=Arundo donax TaxID=35708 RepID=A0A0A8ZA92_ARUDO